jgi:ElaB/YqjD/DUF883 family membrane-anchored ribosome-binding protein
MNLRTLQQTIGQKQAEIDRLCANADALEMTAEAMLKADREKARATASLIREKIRLAILALHALQSRLGTDAAEDWVGQFAFENEPVKLPAEMAHLWAGNIDHALAA